MAKSPGNWHVKSLSSEDDSLASGVLGSDHVVFVLEY